MRTARKPGPDSLVIFAVDLRAGAPAAAFQRTYFYCRGADLFAEPPEPPVRWDPKGNLPWDPSRPPEEIFVFLYPTRTYCEGFGGHLFWDIAPEDRKMIRGLRRRSPIRMTLYKVPIQNTQLLDHPDFFLNEGERKKYLREKNSPSILRDEPLRTSRRFIEFNPQLLARIKEIFAASMTRPNRQDYLYLATKTFGLNLAIRLAFMTRGVMSGELALLRAVLSTSWYQLQDAVFTVFGQTYMKFLGQMTGLLRIGNARVGDFLFIYFQLCFFEFLNRLVLGPLGETPLVTSASGIALILLNILQGMASGGPLVPAINQMRRAGIISHSTMMHFYQLASLSMHFGLFATFGFQTFYAVLTGAVLVLSWSGYILFSTGFKDPDFAAFCDQESLARLDRLALRACGTRLRSGSAGSTRL